MTNKEAIYSLIVARRKFEKDYEELHWDFDATPFDMAISALKAQHSKEDATKGATKGATFGKWIPCSERLPEDSEEYLVTVKWNGINVVDIDQHFSYGWDDCGEDVIAWAELPEPYQEEK